MTELHVDYPQLKAVYLKGVQEAMEAYGFHEAAIESTLLAAAHYQEFRRTIREMANMAHAAYHSGDQEECKTHICEAARNMLEKSKEGAL